MEKVNVIETNYTIKNLSIGKTYVYKVLAWNGAYTSEPSAELDVQFLSLPSVPLNLYEKV